MENPAKPGSFFTRLPARYYFNAAFVCFGVDMFIAIITQGYLPSTRMEVILHGLLLGGLGWLSIIFFLAGIVRWFYAWKNSQPSGQIETDQDNLER